jgi:RimJ/RimL family protein N-acetyltransferase
VLQKLGMTHEGRRRAHTLKWGEYLDSDVYGILRGEWRGRPARET